MQLDDLVAAVLDGDKRAWNELGLRLTEELERFFARSFSESDAEDLTQITLMIIHRKLPDFDVDGERPFVHWVRAIARVQMKEAQRQQGRRERREGRVAHVRRTPATNFSSNLNRNERLEMIERELDQLESPYRRVIENDLAEGDVKEFAKAEQIQLGSVRTRRTRAYAKLRALLRLSPAGKQQ